MELTVVIVNYNVKYFLEQCLRSVFSAIQTIEAEVFVVDNHSSDGSVEWIKKQFPEVNLIANEENVGFSKANNQAIRLAKGKWILLLNPDTIVPENCFSEILSYCANHQRLGGLGVKMLDGSGAYLPESKRGLPTPEVAVYKMLGLTKLFPKSPRFGAYYHGNLPEKEPQKVEVLAGAFMWMRKSILDEVGLLDETYFMYGEDIDLSHRIRLAGYENHYFPYTPIIHYKGESTRKESYRYVRAFYGAMIIFAKRYFTKGQAFFLSTLLYPAIVGKAIWAYLSHRIQKTLLPLFDFSLLWFIFYLLEGYWERNIKEMDGVRYPDVFLFGFVPAYISVWLVSIYFSGGYDRPFKPWKMIRGLAFGTVITLAAYGLLDESFRFSRGMILVGSLLGNIGLIGFRWLLMLLGLGQWKHELTSDLRTIVVGKEIEVERVLGLLQKSNSSIRYLGFFDEHSTQTLGKLSDLDSISKDLQLEQIIFCGSCISNEEIIGRMQGNAQKLTFKIIPNGSDFIIGSQSVETPGVLYSKDFNLAFFSSAIQRNKRLLDLFLTILFTVGSPILFFSKNRKAIFSNFIQVLIGTKTWVGVDIPKPGKGKKFVFDYSESGISTIEKALTQEYLRHWSYKMDLRKILKQFQHC
jgi:GT2 family glycosyltransferase